MIALYIFTIRKSAIPFAFLQMAIGRRTARRTPGVTFAKLMGTGTGKTFTPTDADLKQWAVLFVAEDLDTVDQSPFIQRWKSKSTSFDKYLLDPISSHGKWSKREPFEITGKKHGGGPVIAITRARLKWSQSMRFWRLSSARTRTRPPSVDGLRQYVAIIWR
mgnify:CR=1 FL=1